MYEYTTITIDLTGQGGTGTDGTLYADLFTTVTLANNDTVPPRRYTATVTSGAGSIVLPCTATAIKGTNAPFKVSFTPTSGAEVTLGRIIPTESATAVQLSDLLEVGATSAQPVTTYNVDATTLTISPSIAQLQAMRGLSDGLRVLVQDVGVYRYAAASAVASDEVSVVTPSTAVGRWLREIAGADALPWLNAQDYGALGDGATINTAYLQAWIDAVPATGGIAYLPAGTYLSGNLQVSSKTNLTVTGPGKLKWTGTASGGDSIGIQLLGTCTNVTIDGLRMEGDAVTANRHAGVWCYTGQTFTNIKVINCHIIDTVLGISVCDATGYLAQGNFLDNIVGTASGQGYGIHSDGNTDARVIGNTILRVQRHSVYQGRGSKVVIANNTIRRHREGVSAPVSPLSAIAIARSTDVLVTSNALDACKDGCIGVEGSRTDAGAAVDCRNVIVIGNLITNPLGTNYPVFFGDQDVSADHARTDDCAFIGNTIYQTVSSGPTPIAIFTGRRITIADNTIHRTNMTAGNSLMQIRGVGETSLTSDYTDDIAIRGNQFYGEGSGGDAIEFYGAAGPTGASTSGIRIDATNNRITVPDASWSFVTSQTNPAIRCFDTPSDGLDVTLLAGVSAPGLGPVRLAPGVATPGGAPLKFSSGTLLTTPENGAVEFDGTNYLFGTGSTRYTVAFKDLNQTWSAIQTFASGTTVEGAGDGEFVVNSGNANKSRVRLLRGGTERGYIESNSDGSDAMRVDSDGELLLAANNTVCVTLPTSTADGEVALLVRRNVGGAYTSQRVSMGAADSGGAGYKVLRVAN